VGSPSRAVSGILVLQRYICGTTAAPSMSSFLQDRYGLDVLRAIDEYDRLGPERFFSEHGFAPTTTYELAWEGRRYPPKAILGTAYEFATGQRLGSSDFEGGKTGAVRVLGQLGFTVQEKRRPAR
jgi:hypothetical protein